MGCYTDREKTIYVAFGDQRYDPLALQRRFWQLTRGRWHELLRAVDAAAAPGPDDTGDISRGPESHLIAAAAEESLAAASRAAFGLPAFPEGPLDAVALEAMHDFLRWLAGKD